MTWVVWGLALAIFVLFVSTVAAPGPRSVRPSAQGPELTPDLLRDELDDEFRALEREVMQRQCDHQAFEVAEIGRPSIEWVCGRCGKHWPSTDALVKDRLG